ncbi:transporter [Bacillus pseudomycoides]|nr:transporter [Bacillus pseudomycoides]
MNTFFSRISILTGSTIAISGAYAVIFSNSFLLNFVNFMFYIALLFIIIGGFVFLFQRGFFNVTIYAFKKLGRSNNKMESLIEGEEEHDPKEILYRTYSFTWTYPILITGIILAALSSIMSFAV